MSGDDYGPSGQDDETASLTNSTAEAALLGALMIENELVEEAMALVKQDDFAEAVHGRIFRAITAKVAGGEPATAITLRPMFEADQGLREMGGPDYFGQLTSAGATVVGAPAFARQIATLARFRDMRKAANDFLRELNAFDATSTVTSMVSRMETITAGVETSNDRADVFSGADAIDRVVNNIVSIQDGTTPVGVELAGLEDATKALGHLIPKHLVVLAGRPGMGKSAFMTSAALAACRAAVSDLDEDGNGVPRFGVGIVSLEMGDIDLGQRLAADICHWQRTPVKHEVIRDATAKPEELRRIARAARDIRSWPFEIIEVSGITMSKLRADLRRMKRRMEARGYPLRVVWVDYLQLILPDKPSGNRTQDVTEISQGLKRLAKELDCCIVALSQLSREVEKREDKRPVLADLRESGAIEQDADTVGFFYREEYYLEAREPDAAAKPDAYAAWRDNMDRCRDRMDLIVAKRRGGGLGTKRLIFFREFQAIRNQDYYEMAGR